MSFEKKWKKVPPQAFTADGVLDGTISISDTRLFKVEQLVYVQSNSQSPKTLKVNAVLSPTQLKVGPRDSEPYEREDVSQFLVSDSASISAAEQPRVRLGQEEFTRATFEEEPTNATRVMSVDELGSPQNSDNPTPVVLEFVRNGSPQKVVEDTSDPTNNRPLPVKLSGVQGDVTIEADNINLQVQLEGEYDSVDNPRPDSIGIVAHERGLTQDQTKQLLRPTATRGSSDTDTVSQDVSLHDHAGDQYTQVNPLPVIGSFERFFPLIAASNWMKLANYDRVVPIFSNNNTVVTLQYYEDGNIIGDVVINLAAPFSWDFEMRHFLNDDDGSQLLNDDESVLNLD